MSGRRVAFGLAVVTGAVVLGSLVGRGWLEMPHRSERRFAAYVDELRAAGKPTSLAELLGPDPPDAENASVEILAALDELTGRFGPESRWPKIGPWGDRLSEEETPERFAELRAFLTDFGPFLDRLAAALDRPRCRFNFAGPAGFEDMDGTLAMQRIGRVLSGVALVVEPRRIDAVRLKLRLARRNEPVHGVDWLVASGSARSAAWTIQREVEEGATDSALLRAQVDELLTGDWTAKAPALFSTMRTKEISMLATWLADGVPETFARDVEFGPIRLSLDKPDPDAVVDDCQFLEEAAGLPVSPTSAYFRAVTALAQPGSKTKRPSAYRAWLGVRGFVRVDATTRLARVCLALAEREARTGAFPATLDELATAFPDGVPLDPFTDAPFVYERTDPGVRVASLGRLTEDPAPQEDERHEQGLLWELKH
jgi:hypothetical protein